MLKIIKFQRIFKKFYLKKFVFEKSKGLNKNLNKIKKENFILDEIENENKGKLF